MNKDRIFTLGVITAIFVFISLGTWQAKRLVWKEEIIAQITFCREAEALSYPLPNDMTIDEVRFRKMAVEGTYLHEHELLLEAKYHNNKIGLHILTPLQLANGQAVLINRGWVPKDKKESTTRLETIAKKEAAVLGIIRQSHNIKWYMPQNHPDKQEWYWIDIPTMQHYLKTHADITLLPFVIQRTGEADGTLPAPLKADFKVRNDHLQYAVTWFLLALVTLIMYIYFLYQKKQ